MSRTGQLNKVISYKKCDGKKSCFKSMPASTISDCRYQATQACSNRRYSITKSKIVTATWGKKRLLDLHGNEDYCIKYKNRSEEFDRCR